MKIDAINKIEIKNFKIETSLLVDGLIVGVVAGIVGVIYRFLITFSEKCVHFIANKLPENYFLALPLMFFLIILAFILGFIIKKEPHASGSGIPQVSAEVTGRIKTNPVSVLFYKMFGGFLASIGGLSLGREGPSIQLGAMSGKIVAKILKRNVIREKYLLTCGASAGLSVAFNAPLAGVLFSLEEVHKHISKKLIICCFSAAVVADVITQYVFGFGATFNFKEAEKIDFKLYALVILLGVFLGIFGTFYNVLMKLCYKFYTKLNINIVLRPLVAMFFSLIMFLFFPLVLGSGHGLLEKLITYKYSLLFLILLYFIKTFFSIISFTSGVPGGIFLPILIQGGLLGVIFSTLVGGEYLITFIILAMAGYLTAVVRSPLTSIILLFEMTQSIKFFLPIAICVLCSYYTANALRTKPVYEYLLDRLLLNNNANNLNLDNSEIEIITTINSDSTLINKKIKDLSLPKNCLITDIENNLGQTIPRGNTTLKAGDKLTLIMPKDRVDEFLEKFGGESDGIWLSTWLLFI